MVFWEKSLDTYSLYLLLYYRLHLVHTRVVNIKTVALSPPSLPCFFSSFYHFGCKFFV